MKTWDRWRLTQSSRRAFLGGLGAAITLPWLPSLLPRAARADAQAPVRLVFWFAPNGMNMVDLTPAGVGDGWELTPILSPLAPVRDEVTVLTGMTNLAGIDARAGDHARGTGAFLTCQTPSYDGIEVGISVDQVAAAQADTPFPSLQLGTEGGPNVGFCDSGYACSYSRNISWAGPATPLPKMTNPTVVFDRLFAGMDGAMTEVERARRRVYRRSVLDAAATDARDLQRLLAVEDRRRLDEYLTGIRDLEVRLDRGDVHAGCAAPGRPSETDDLELLVDTMSELTVVAAQCDLTRYVTFMLGDATSNRNYGFIGAPGAHHELSHHQDAPETLEKLTLINTWTMERFAHLLWRMRSVPEGDGTLLDHSLVLLGSDISDGNRHNHDEMPVILAGRGGGAVRPGRHLVLPGTPMANLYVSMLRAAGVHADTFGSDGTGPVHELA